MYTSGRYSLIRYSSGREGRTIPVAGSFASFLGAVAGGSVPVEVRGRYGGDLQCHAEMSISASCSLRASDILTAGAQMSANVLPQTAFNTELLAQANGRKNLLTALVGNTALHTCAQAGKNVSATLVLAAILAERIKGSKNVTASLSAWEVFTTLPQATFRIVQRASFSLSIPPGGELRVDSGLFTVLLDGENVLHTQSGDWIEVSRELLRLGVECAAGGALKRLLIYTEKYL